MEPADDPDLDARVDALFTGRPEEFTRSRDALARELRGDGRREAAAGVAALRRPSRTADTLNRLARADPGRMAALLDAVDALAVAQERMREAGDAGALHAAAAAEATALGAFPGGPDLINALRFTARSPDTRDDLRRGRLVREAPPDSAAGPFGLAPPPGPTPAPRRRLRVAPEPLAAEPDPVPTARAARADPAEDAARRARIAAATAALDAARDDDRAARARREEAERAADAAADEAGRRRAEVDRLREELAAAEAASASQEALVAATDADRHAARDDERRAAEALAAAREAARGVLDG